MKRCFLRVSNKPQGLDAACAALQAGVHRHDVLEAAIRALEIDPADDSVGYGGYPNLLGVMELDAVFMDGNSRTCGAVAGVTHYLPVRIARALMEQNLHTLLIADGAEHFAAACGLPPEPTLSDSQRAAWQSTIAPWLDQASPTSWMAKIRTMAASRWDNFDTTLMLAQDAHGMSAAGSTAGWPYKYPGRVGDTAVIGAGMYVDSRYGGAACTYTGEMSIRSGTARLVVEQLRAGRSPEAAVRNALEDVQALTGGVMRTLVVHALNGEGEAYAAALHAQYPIAYHYWCEGMAQPVLRPVATIAT